MSLHRLEKIDSRLITLYAVLDSWCDDELETHQCATDKDADSPYSVIMEIITRHQRLLDQAAVQTDYHRSELVEQAQSGKDLRARLRSQLFALLCFLDSLAEEHDDDLTNSLDEVLQASLSKIIDHSEEHQHLLH